MKLSTKIAGLLLFASTTVNANANLLVNGSFEANPVTANSNCLGYSWCIRSLSSTPGWTQFGDGVDLVHNNYVQPPPVLLDASNGVQFLDLNQGLLLGGLYQEVSATPGQTYRLSLDTAAWATNSIGGTVKYVLFDRSTSTELASGLFTDNVGGTWVNRTLDATAISSSIMVSIYGTHATQAGMGLDNVVLTAVPEPETYMLFLGGLLMLGTVARRRRK